MRGRSADQSRPRSSNEEGNISPAEVEERNYAMPDDTIMATMATQFDVTRLRQSTLPRCQ